MNRINQMFFKQESENPWKLFKKGRHFQKGFGRCLDQLSITILLDSHDLVILQNQLQHKVK